MIFHEMMLVKFVQKDRAMKYCVEECLLKEMP